MSKVYKYDVETADEQLTDALNYLHYAGEAMQMFIEESSDRNFEAYAMQSVQSNGSPYDNGAVSLIERKLAMFRALPDEDEMIERVTEYMMVEINSLMEGDPDIDSAEAFHDAFQFALFQAIDDAGNGDSQIREDMHEMIDEPELENAVGRMIVKSA